MRPAHAPAHRRSKKLAQETQSQPASGKVRAPSSSCTGPRQGRGGEPQDGLVHGASGSCRTGAAAEAGWPTLVPSGLSTSANGPGSAASCSADAATVSVSPSALDRTTRAGSPSRRRSFLRSSGSAERLRRHPRPPEGPRTTPRGCPARRRRWRSTSPARGSSGSGQCAARGSGCSRGGCAGRGNGRRVPGCRGRTATAELTPAFAAGRRPRRCGFAYRGEPPALVPARVAHERTPSRTPRSLSVSET